MASQKVTFWVGGEDWDHIASKDEHTATLCGLTVRELDDRAFLVRFPNDFPIPRPSVEDLCPECKEAADYDFQEVA